MLNPENAILQPHQCKNLNLSQYLNDLEVRQRLFEGFFSQLLNL